MVSVTVIAAAIVDFTTKAQKKKFDTEEEAIQNYANGLAGIIADAIKSATVTVPVIPVTTTGGSGATNLPVSATIS